MKIGKIAALAMCLSLAANFLPVLQTAAVMAERVVVSEDFSGGADGASLGELDGWTEVNAYLPSGESNNNIYTIRTENNASENQVASFVKGPQSGESRLWAARAIPLPPDANQLSVEFKIRSVSGGGLFDIGFGSGASYGSNGHVRLDFGSSQIIWRAGIGGTWASSANFDTSGGWNTVKLTVDPHAKQSGAVRGRISAEINGVSRGGDWMNSTGSGTVFLPDSVAFGWVRTQAVGAEVELDDLKVSALLQIPFEITEETQSKDIEPTAPLKLVFSGGIDPASLAQAEFSLQNADAAIRSMEISSENDRVLFVSFDGPLSFDTEYALSAAGLYDIDGQRMEAGNFVFRTRARRLSVSEPIFYTGYGQEEQSTADVFAEGRLTAVVEYQNEKENASALALMALLKENKLIDIICKERTLTEGEAGRFELTMDTSGGTRAVVLLWDSLTGMRPLSGVTMLGADGITAAEMDCAAAVDEVTANADYDAFTVTLSAKGESGEAGFCILKPGYRLSDVTAGNLGAALLEIGQAKTTENVVYTYSEKDIAPGQYVYTAVLGGMDTEVFLFPSSVAAEALGLVKAADAGGLQKLLEDDPAAVERGYRVTDVLGQLPEGYDGLLDKGMFLSQLAGKDFQTVAAYRTALNKAFEEQQDKEEAVSNLIKSVNAADWSELEQILRAGVKLLPLDWDGPYAELSGSKRVTLYKHLAEDYTFANCTEIQKAFDHWAKELLQAGDKGSSGGGGGGSGSKMSFASGTPADAEQRNDAETGKGLFTDCSQFAWALEAIESLAAQDIINGVGDGLFAPTKTVTREEFVKMLAGALELPESRDGCAFTDVPAGSWFYPYVSAAVGSDVVRGISDTEFGAGKQITRADMAVLCIRALEYKGIHLPAGVEIAFEDADEIPAYATESVDTLQSAGLISGVGGNRFAPMEAANRAMAAKIIYGVRNVMKGERR